MRDDSLLLLTKPDKFSRLYPELYSLVMFPVTHPNVIFVWFGVFTVDEFDDIVIKLKDNVSFSRQRTEKAGLVALSYAFGEECNLIDVVIYEHELFELVVLS